MNKYIFEPDRDNELLENLSKQEYYKTYYMLNKKERKVVDGIYTETAEQYDYEFCQRNYPYYK